MDGAGVLVASDWPRDSHLDWQSPGGPTGLLQLRVNARAWLCKRINYNLEVKSTSFPGFAPIYTSQILVSNEDCHALC